MSDNIYRRAATLVFGAYLGASLIGSLADREQAERTAAPFVRRDFGAALQQQATRTPVPAGWTGRQQKILESFATGNIDWVKTAADHDVHRRRQDLLESANARNTVLLPGLAGERSALIVTDGRDVVTVDPALSDDQIDRDLYSLLAYAAKTERAQGVYTLTPDRQLIEGRVFAPGPSVPEEPQNIAPASPAFRYDII